MRAPVPAPDDVTSAYDREAVEAAVAEALRARHIPLWEIVVLVVASALSVPLAAVLVGLLVWLVLW